MSDVQLLLNGEIYSGWKSVKIGRSLDMLANTFELTLTDNQAAKARTIKLGSPCRVRIDGETIITGYVDRIRPSYNGKSRSLEVSGRSKTADLVDCSIPPDDLDGVQQNQQTLLQLAQYVCGKIRLKARSEINDLLPIEVAVAEAEQTLFEFLEKHSGAAGVMLLSDTDGNLVITRGSTQRIDTALILGKNIEEAEGEFNHRDRFSSYLITGQQVGSDNSYGESAAHVSGVSYDTMMRYRPTTIIGDNLDLQQAKRQAEWKRNVHYGRSRQATYIVNGWRHANDLWRPNRNVLVCDEWMGFTGKDGKGEWLMIGTVEYLFDNRGERTRLTVMPREAYDLISLPSEDGGDW
jgi:prophage tail gpP-like protein